MKNPNEEENKMDEEPKIGKEPKIEKATESTEEEKKERQKEDDLREELKVKETQHHNNMKRLNGGVHQLGPGQNVSVVPIDQEIEHRKIMVRMKELEIANDGFINPERQFQMHDEWRTLNRKKMEEFPDGLKDHKEILDKVIKQKETILKENPELEFRINEIRNQLGMELKDFDRVKPDYVG